MSSQHYVYIHRRETDRAIFYVGKGKDRRAWSRTGRNRYWGHIANKHGVVVEIVKRDMPEPCALALERVLIARLRGEGIANQTDGGGGISGWTHSDETKARIAAHQKGREFTPKMRAALTAYNTNKRLTDDHKAKLSLAKKGKPRAPHSVATRAKIAASHIGIRPSEDTLAKMSASKIGKAVGRNSPTYDHTIRTWLHMDGDQFEGTRADFIGRYSLRDSCVSELINKRRKSVKGWRLI